MFPLHCFRKRYIGKMVKKRGEHFLVLSVKFTAILDFETLWPVTKSSHLHTHIFLPDLFMTLTANSKLNFQLSALRTAQLVKIPFIVFQSGALTGSSRAKLVMRTHTRSTRLAMLTTKVEQYSLDISLSRTSYLSREICILEELGPSKSVEILYFSNR